MCVCVCVCVQEQTCVPGKVQVSAATRALLHPSEPLQATGGVHCKGKGLQETFLWDPEHTGHTDINPTVITTSPARSRSAGIRKRVQIQDPSGAEASPRESLDGPLSGGQGQGHGHAASRVSPQPVVTSCILTRKSISSRLHGAPKRSVSTFFTSAAAAAAAPSSADDPAMSSNDHSAALTFRLHVPAGAGDGSAPSSSCSPRDTREARVARLPSSVLQAEGSGITLHTLAAAAAGDGRSSMAAKEPSSESNVRSSTLTRKSARSRRISALVIDHDRGPRSSGDGDLRSGPLGSEPLGSGTDHDSGPLSAFASPSGALVRLLSHARTKPAELSTQVKGSSRARRTSSTMLSGSLPGPLDFTGLRMLAAHVTTGSKSCVRRSLDCAVDSSPRGSLDDRRGKIASYRRSGSSHMGPE